MVALVAPVLVAGVYVANLWAAGQRDRLAAAAAAQAFSADLARGGHPNTNPVVLAFVG